MPRNAKPTRRFSPAADACKTAAPEGLRPPIVFALAAAHVLLFAGGFPPVGIWPLTLLAPLPLALLAIHARRTSHAIVAVACLQPLAWLFLQAWMTQMTIPGYLAAPLILTLYALLLIWLIRRLDRHRRFGRWPMTFMLPLIWTGLEFLRGRVAFDGYPWYLLAHPLVETPGSVFVQSADLFGTYFVSFLAASISGIVLDLWRSRMRSRPISPSTRLTIAAMCTVLVLNVAYGMWRSRSADNLRQGPDVLLIQTNLPQNNKVRWTYEQQIEGFRDFARLTFDAHQSTGGQADLVVWPETMLPGMGLEPDAIRFLQENRYGTADLFATAIAEMSQSLETPMLVGSGSYLGLGVEGDQWLWDAHYNSAYLVTPEGLPYQRYDKVFLTPFGETMPYISKWQWLEEKLLAFGASGMRFDLDAGDEIRLISLPYDGNTLNVATPICFEDTVGTVCREMIYGGGGKRAGLLLNLSNDGWFGASDAGRTQHAQMARFRCIENRVPMVRSVNTGLSLSIDSAGRILGRVGEGRYGRGQQPGWLLARVELDDRSTLYGRIGDAFGWVSLLMTSGVLLIVMATRWVGSHGSDTLPHPRDGREPDRGLARPPLHPKGSRTAAPHP